MYSGKDIVFMCPYCNHIIKCEGEIYGLKDGITRSIYCDECEKIILVRNCKVFS